MRKKCYEMQIPSPILWRRKLRQASEAALPELPCKLLTDGGLKKLGSFTNTRSTGLIFLGNVFTLSQPSVAQRLSSRNVVGVPLGMGQQRDAGLPSNGDWGQTQYWSTLFKLCTLAGINGVAL